MKRKQPRKKSPAKNPVVSPQADRFGNPLVTLEAGRAVLAQGYQREPVTYRAFLGAAKKAEEIGARGHYAKPVKIREAGPWYVEIWGRKPTLEVGPGGKLIPIKNPSRGNPPRETERWETVGGHFTYSLQSDGRILVHTKGKTGWKLLQWKSGKPITQGYFFGLVKDRGPTEFRKIPTVGPQGNPRTAPWMIGVKEKQRAYEKELKQKIKAAGVGVFLWRPDGRYQKNEALKLFKDGNAAARWAEQLTAQDPNPETQGYVARQLHFMPNPPRGNPPRAGNGNLAPRGYQQVYWQLGKVEARKDPSGADGHPCGPKCRASRHWYKHSFKPGARLYMSKDGKTLLVRGK